MELGISTSALSASSWRNELPDVNFIEINRRFCWVPFSKTIIDREKPKIKGKKTSFHSGLYHLFEDEFNEINNKIFENEIKLLSDLGGDFLIFHTPNKIFSAEEEVMLRKFISFANEKNVKLCYESNAQFDGAKVIQMLKDFPELDYNLDIGHFNLGIAKNTLGMSLNSFLDKIKNRIKYIHAHNNFGERDEHNSIENGTLDWKYIFKNLDLKNVRIIMENKNIKDSMKSYEKVSSFLSS